MKFMKLRSTGAGITRTKEKLFKNTLTKREGKVQKYKERLAKGSRKENLVS